MELKRVSGYWLGNSSTQESSPHSEVLSPIGLRDQEIHSEFLRKTIHMLPGLLPFLFVLTRHPDPLPALSLIIVAIICVVGTVIFLSLEQRLRRRGESNFYSTVLSYPLIIMLTLLLFPDRSECAMVVVIILGLGDGSACIMGRMFGRRKLPWNRKKSWAGLCGFVLVSAPLAILAYWLEARNPVVSLETAMICGGCAALAGAIAESLPVQLTDNLRVGLAAAVTVISTTQILVP